MAAAAAVVGIIMQVGGLGMDFYANNQEIQTQNKLKNQNIRAAELDIKTLNDQWADQRELVRIDRSMADGAIRAAAVSSGVLITSGSVQNALVTNEQQRAMEEAAIFTAVRSQQEALRQEVITLNIAGQARQRGANLQQTSTAIQGAAGIATSIAAFQSS